jgi:DNA-binding response OmpR family regulator
VTKVAVLEDEELIRTMLRMNLEGEGYHVDAYRDGESFLSTLDAAHYDLLVLDLLLPGADGGHVLRSLRGRGRNTPVLVVTARRDVETRVRLLDNGADDYLAKPFELPELLARVRALIRRSQGERSIPSHRQVRVGDCRVNLDTRLVVGPGGPVFLSEREAALLDLFVRNADRVLSRSEILEEVWGLDVDPTPRTVNNYILRFRRLFERHRVRPRHFLTVRAAGYRYRP